MFLLVIFPESLAEIFRCVNRLTNGLVIHADCLFIHGSINIGISMYVKLVSFTSFIRMIMCHIPVLVVDARAISVS